MVPTCCELMWMVAAGGEEHYVNQAAVHLGLSAVKCSAGDGFWCTTRRWDCDPLPKALLSWSMLGNVLTTAGLKKNVFRPICCQYALGVASFPAFAFSGFAEGTSLRHIQQNGWRFVSTVLLGASITGMGIKWFEPREGEELRIEAALSCYWSLQQWNRNHYEKWIHPKRHCTMRHCTTTFPFRKWSHAQKCRHNAGWRGHTLQFCAFCRWDVLNMPESLARAAASLSSWTTVTEPLLIFLANDSNGNIKPLMIRILRWQLPSLIVIHSAGDKSVQTCPSHWRLPFSAPTPERMSWASGFTQGLGSHGVYWVNIEILIE